MLHTVCSRRRVIDAPDIVVSHIIKGRIPEAIHKPVNQLLKPTRPSITNGWLSVSRYPRFTRMWQGTELNLSIGGVRAYNHENLYSKKTVEKFKVFIGFKNLVCCNLCVSTDGFKKRAAGGGRAGFVRCLVAVIPAIRCRTPCKADGSNAGTMPYRTPVRPAYRQDTVVSIPARSGETTASCYGFTDCHINAVAKAYYADENFSRGDNPEIDLWRVYNLFTGANKSSYIDTFLDRSLNATELITGIGRAIEGDAEYRWFVE